METTIKTDVIIIGAGLTGLSLACQLIRYGIDVDYHVVPLYPHVAEVFGANEPFNVLLSPDNYIGFVSSETSLSGLKVYSNEVIGHS